MFVTNAPNEQERDEGRACKKPTLAVNRRTPLHFPSNSSSSKMKCASNKTAQICTWWMAYSFIQCQFSPFEIRPECTAKWLLFRHQNYREVKCLCAHIVRITSIHTHPPWWAELMCSNKNKTFEIPPQVLAAAAALIYAHVVSEWVCVLVAHMACSNKIMEFHTGEIEIEKSIFKTFMYAHWCDLIGTLTISPARFFNVLCLCFLFACFHFSTSFSLTLFTLAMQTTNNSTAANGGCVLSICYHRKFFTKLLSFCQCLPYSPGDGYGLAQSFFLSKAVPTDISMVCDCDTHASTIQEIYIYKWCRNTRRHTHVWPKRVNKTAAVSKAEL